MPGLDDHPLVPLPLGRANGLRAVEGLEGTIIWWAAARLFDEPPDDARIRSALRLLAELAAYRRTQGWLEERTEAVDAFLRWAMNVPALSDDSP